MICREVLHFCGGWSKRKLATSPRSAARTNERTTKLVVSRDVGFSKLDLSRIVIAASVPACDAVRPLFHFGPQACWSQAATRRALRQVIVPLVSSARLFRLLLLMLLLPLQRNLSSNNGIERHIQAREQHKPS